MTNPILFSGGPGSLSAASSASTNNALNRNDSQGSISPSNPRSPNSTFSANSASANSEKISIFEATQTLFKVALKTSQNPAEITIVDNQVLSQLKTLLAQIPDILTLNEEAALQSTQDQYDQDRKNSSSPRKLKVNK